MKASLAIVAGTLFSHPLQRFKIFGGPRETDGANCESPTELARQVVDATVEFGVCIAGLTIGYISIDHLELELKAKNGTDVIYNII